LETPSSRLATNSRSPTSLVRRRPADDLQHLLLGLRERAGAVEPQELEIPGDRRERRPELVRDGREQRVLQLVQLPQLLDVFALTENGAAVEQEQPGEDQDDEAAPAERNEIRAVGLGELVERDRCRRARRPGPRPARRCAPPRA
jgi:hypothetical protein